MTITDTIRLQTEYFRTNVSLPSSVLADVGIHTLQRSLQYLGKRRTKADNQAREIVRALMVEVSLQGLRDAESAIARFSGSGRVSNRRFRIPLLSQYAAH